MVVVVFEVGLGADFGGASGLRLERREVSPLNANRSESAVDDSGAR